MGRPSEARPFFAMEAILKINLLLAPALMLLLLACGGSQPAPDSAADGQTDTTGTPPDTALVQIKETFVTESKPEENVDSIAYIGGEQPLAVVTGKESHNLIVVDILAGKRLKVVGEPGSAENQFKRPNGIQAIDDMVLVVERDNKRVQVLSVPEMTHLAYIGADVLERPYGLSCFKKGDAYELYVTDDYELEEGAAIPPGYHDNRIKHFRFTKTDNTITSELVKTWGNSEGPGILFKVESLLADPENGVLLIANEEGEHAGINVYDLEGNFQGKKLDTSAFLGQPEGLAIYAKGDHNYYVTTDQQSSVTVFHLYNRKTLAHVTSFRGEVTANTDGISVSTDAHPGYPEGVLLAIQDDQALSAFSWADIFAAVKP